MDYYFVKIGAHYFLHFIFPVVIAYIFFKNNWKKAYFIMLCTMLVDVDHLFSTPIFDATRNSIGFHLFHSYPAIAIYVLGAIFLKGNYRIIAVGLLFHMFTDFQDFYFWNYRL
ncbi:DUF6122 family protein [Frigoriflavimonas asaccharolytica]|uniref:Uncharacterized protein n=1 Tax=Frigoriflavimonas asaccharolytica TaxID=2735899 RepID=A0A8J8K7P3_9FLAO|nr:DUF6122 family protein [Frigoriflavimonas asaccharolytica]NRS91157.1 hypothetical protein [Frigoriflavimonas asaccharolytica]